MRDNKVFWAKWLTSFEKCICLKNISGAWKKLLFGAEVIRTTKLAKNNNNEHSNNLREQTYNLIEKNINFRIPFLHSDWVNLYLD